MYKRILVPVENSDYDAAIIEHVSRLAKMCESSIVIIHVADGWVARNSRQLDKFINDLLRGTLRAQSQTQ